MRLLGMTVAIQQFLAFLCACLPTYRPLLPNEVRVRRIVRDWGASFSVLLSRRSRSSASKTLLSESSARKTRNSRYNPYDNLDDSSNHIIALPIAQEGSDVPSDRAENFYPLDTIKMQHDMHVV